MAAIAERIPHPSRLTQLVQTHPFDMAAPQWVDDTRFDIAHHIRRAAVPEPGDDAALFPMIADLMERRLDRDHPLWECWIGGLWRASMATTAAATHTAWGAAEFIAGLLAPAAPSSLYGSLTTMRRYSAARVSLNDFATVCHAFGVTLNDVALTAITDSFRTALLRRGEKPRRTSLRTLIPVSIRSPEAMNRTDIRVSAMLPYLPVDEDDPVKQLRLVHARLERIKGSGEREAASAFVTLTNFLPFAATAWTVRLLSRLRQHSVVTLATNVPGPRQRLEVLGHPVVELLPVPPIVMQLRTVIGMLSYVDQLIFGITVDYDAIPDVDEIAGGIELAVERLVVHARKRTITKKHRRLSVVVN